MRFPKTLFVHGRPGPHPAHGKYAHLINADFEFEDTILRWHDKPDAGKLKRYLSWLFNAFKLASKKSYKIYLAECARVPLAVMKKLRLISKKRHVLALLDDEQLYFIEQNIYSRSAATISKFFLNNCDGFIVVGKMQESILNRLMDNDILRKNSNIARTFNGISMNRYNRLSRLSPNLKTNTIIYIANGPGSFRIHYKGLDLLIKAFGRALDQNPDLKLIIVGDWTKESQKQTLKKVQQSKYDRIEFTGKVSDLGPYLERSSLYVHPARGEAWGISINEAMSAGLPCLVSCWTGAKEIVEQVSPEMIFNLSANEIAEKIKWYYDLSENEKIMLSEKGRDIVRNYTEVKAGETFVNAFNELIQKIEPSN